jgi:hypothetical protein
MTYFLKQISKNEIKDLAQVFNNTRKTKIKPSYFIRKYNALGDGSFISVIAYYNQIPVSHSACLPFSIVKSDQTLLKSAIFVDTATVKDHQKKGLFLKTNLKLTEIAKKQNFDLLFHFPNNKTFGGLSKHLERQHISDFYSFIIKTKTIFPVLKLLNKLNCKTLIRAYFKLIIILSKSRRVAFESSVIRQGFYGIRHDAAYFKYKTYSSNFVLNLSGDKYWIKPSDGIIVGDYEIMNFESSIKKLRRFCYFAGINKINFIVNEGTKEYYLLNKHIKPKKSLPICIKILKDINLDTSKLKFTFADSDNF